MIATTTDNRKQQYGRPHRKYLSFWRYCKYVENADIFAFICHITTNVLAKEKREYYCHSMLVYMEYILSSDIRSVARAIRISGLAGHIATSGCRLLSQSFGAAFVELVVVENLTAAVVNDHTICSST